jgi:hypothetical protein
MRLGREKRRSVKFNGINRPLSLSLSLSHSQGSLDFVIGPLYSRACRHRRRPGGYLLLLRPSEKIYGATWTCLDGGGGGGLVRIIKFWSPLSLFHLQRPWDIVLELLLSLSNNTSVFVFVVVSCVSSSSGGIVN